MPTKAHRREDPMQTSCAIDILVTCRGSVEFSARDDVGIAAPRWPVLSPSHAAIVVGTGVFRIQPYRFGEIGDGAVEIASCRAKPGRDCR